MYKYYAQFDLVTGLIFSVVQSQFDVVGDDIIVVEDKGVLGKKWDGENIIDMPKVLKYKVWDKPQFIFMLGMSVLAQINSGESEELAFYKYILDNSPHVDLNIAEFRAMVEALNIAGLIDTEKLAALLVQE